jgi:hypothetical protein
MESEMTGFLRAAPIIWALIIGFAEISPPAQAGSALAGSGDPDRSAEYEAFLDNDHFDQARVDSRFAEILPELRRFRVLIVPSYLSDTAFEANKRGMADYFVRHVEWLGEAGIDVEVVAIESEAPVAENAIRVASAVRESVKPVCLLTHSKGGLDALDFLIHASSEERSKVACWISLQAPFKGTPLADIVATTPVIGDLAGAVLLALGGNAESLRDLTTEARSRYMAENAPAIRHIIATIPTLCLATTVETPEAGLISAFMALTLGYLEGESIPSDGVVPTDSAILPGANHVIARNVDHNASVSTPLAASRPVDSERLLKVLFVLLLGPEWT